MHPQSHHPLHKSPTLHPTPASSCSSLVFDLLYHREDGMKSLLVLLVQGFESGRMLFFKLLNSTTPASATPIAPSPSSAEVHELADATLSSDSFHALQAHSARVTSIVSFQASESLFDIPLLVSASLDGTVAMWEARTANLLFRLHAPSPILDLTRPTQPPLPQQYPAIDADASVAPAVRTREGGVLCSDMTLVCAICADLSVRLLSVEKMNWVACLRGHDSIPRAVFREAWATSADVVFVQTARGSIFIWSISTSTLEEVLEGGADDGLEFVWRFPMFAGAAAPIPKLTALTRTISGTPSRSRHASNTSALDSSVPDSPVVVPPRRAKSNSDFTALSLDTAVTSTTGGVVRSSSSTLQGINELAAETLSPESFNGSSAQGSSPQPTRSPPPAPAPAHSTAILSSSSDDPNLTPPRIARAVTAPNSRRPSYLTPIVTSVPSAASPQSSSAAAIPWAVHYGLQRLWKLGGRGGLWGATGSAGGTDDGASGSSVLQSACSGGSGVLTSFGASSNLICSFESLPALHLSVLSVDIGFLTAEMRQQYAPLNATSDRSVAAAASIVPDGTDAPALTLETKQRAEVYKEILKLLLDWSDADEPDADADESAAVIAQSSKGVPGSRLSAKADVLHILREQFHMRPPFSGSRDRVSSALGGSLPTCYASYSPTNNALSILLPRACSVRANRKLVASHSHSSTAASSAVVGVELCHLSRWSIGPNFTATHSLCLTTVLLSLLGSSDIQLHNYYSLIENFYNATLPALHPGSSGASNHPPALSLWRYTEADLPFLASYALHEHDDIRRASKLLIQGLIGRVSMLSELEAWSREWGSFYEQMGRPPALPWLDTSMADPTAPPTFPAPPRLVSDFEFMTCMILCYLQQAAAKKRAALALSMHREAAQQDAAAELQIQSHIRASSLSSASSSAKSPSRRTSLEHPPVISLDSSLLTGLSLKVQPSPSRHLLSAQEAKRDGESRSVHNSETSPARLLPATLFPATPLASAPPSVDRTPFIVSTLLRLLSQTHQDSTIHSLPKSSICVELLIQGLTVSSHSLSSAAARAPDEPIPESNPFWQQIPKHALEPLYRILFDLSFVQPTRDAAGSAASLGSSGRRPSNGDLRAPNTTGPSSPVSFSSTCRVLLFELAKFDLHAFIHWARCEMFGYPGLQSGSGVAVPGTDFNGADLPTAPSQIKKSVAAAAAAASAAVHDPSVPLVDAESTGYASIKALQFDEYRIQLVGMLVTLPRKFAQRMSYAITRSLVELLIQMLDPLIVAQTRTASAFIAGGPAGSSAAPGMGGVGASAAAASAASSSAAAHAASFPHSLRTRLQLLISPLWPYLSSKCCWLDYSAATNKLAFTENPRWIFSERLSRLSVPAERRMFIERDGVALLSQEPSIPIYDLSYASRWRTLDGCCAPFSDIDAISFSANGHLLASYSPNDGQTAAIRVWSTDYESAGVGSGFFGTRLLLKAVFKVHPFCLQTIQLPAIPKPKPPPNAPFTSALLGLPQGPHAACNIRFKDVQHIRLTREDETTVTLTLAV